MAVPVDSDRLRRRLDDAELPERRQESFFLAL
jgi:hypothetical protein